MTTTIYCYRCGGPRTLQLRRVFRLVCLRCGHDRWTSDRARVPIFPEGTFILTVFDRAFLRALGIGTGQVPHVEGLYQ